MAMSCVAPANVRSSTAAISTVPGAPASVKGTMLVARAIVRSAPAIHWRRSPKRSTSGAQSGFKVHGSVSEEKTPIVASDTPFTRR